MMPLLQPQMLSNPLQTNNGATAPDPSSSVKKFSCIAISYVNPPEIQKVVVEHIVRKGDMGPQVHSSLQLHSSSGKTPRPNNEKDVYKLNCFLVIPACLILRFVSRILKSLLSPAADSQKTYSTTCSLSTFVNSAFGIVKDGAELFAQFMNTFQDPAEKPSSHLHRLQVALNLAV